MIFDFFVTIFLSFISIYLTHKLGSKLKGNSCLSSSLVTVLFYICFYILGAKYLIYSKIVFGASFVGMVKKIKLSKSFLMLSTILFSLIYIFLYRYFSQFGGALGFSAFVACLASLLIIDLSPCLLSQRK